MFTKENTVSTVKNLNSIFSVIYSVYLVYSVVKKYLQNEKNPDNSYFVSIFEFHV